MKEHQNTVVCTHSEMSVRFSDNLNGEEGGKGLDTEVDVC